MQEFERAKLGFELLITDPVMVDGRSVRQRLREQKLADLRHLRAQEQSVKHFVLKWLGKAIHGLLWGFIRLMWAWCWCLDKVFDGILYTKKWLDTWRAMH